MVVTRGKEWWGEVEEGERWINDAGRGPDTGAEHIEMCTIELYT